MPIDPSWPENRINEIIGEAKLDAVITTDNYLSKASGIKAILVDNGNVVDFNDKDNSNAIAYILFTSGSTGKPKGVEVKHEALLNFIDGISNAIDFSSQKRIACFTSALFDIFFLKALWQYIKGLPLS